MIVDSKERRGLPTSSNQSHHRCSDFPVSLKLLSAKNAFFAFSCPCTNITSR